jgi:hypothetical protein
MKTYLLLLLLFPLSVLADCPDVIQLQGLKSKVNFCHSKEGLVSENCYQDKSCDWKGQLQTIKKIVPTEEQLTMGKNPNSVKCSLAGKMVHLFRDNKDNEQTFCEIFPHKFLDVAAFD